MRNVYVGYQPCEVSWRCDTIRFDLAGSDLSEHDYSVESLTLERLVRSTQAQLIVKAQDMSGVFLL